VKKNVLIIGYGSIGKRHAKILKKFKDVAKIYIFTKQKCKSFNKISNINEIKKISPDYIIISSRTSEHFMHLSFIEKNFKNRLILVEKPLFDTSKNLKIKNNKVFVGYNLRYHPIINFIKNFIKNKKIFSININCQSYLPNWRKNINYTKSNSARKTHGGGVLLELSHEIDYLQLIFKRVTKLHNSLVKKISDLKIDTEDYVLIAGKTAMANFYMSLNFFSLQSQRRIMVSGNMFNLEADLLKNTVKIFEKGKIKNKKFKVDKNYTYMKQHRCLLDGNLTQACKYNEGVKLMSLINKIKNFKLNAKK